MPHLLQKERLLVTGVFLLALSLTAIEMLSMRSALVAFGRDFQFFIIPLALLGIGVGGILTLTTAILTHRGMRAWCSLGYAAVTPVQFLLAHATAHLSNPTLAMVLFFTASFVAYTLCGWILSSVLQEQREHIPLLYFVDLLGASLGALGIVFFLNAFGYERSVWLVAALSCVPALLWLGRKYAPLSRVTLSIALSGIVLVCLGMFGPSASFSLSCKNAPVAYTGSNAFSQISAIRAPLSTFQDLGNYRAPTNPPYDEYLLQVDCTYGTPLIVAPSMEDLTFMRESLRGIAPAYMEHRDQWSVFIASSGAGTDVIRAKLFGATGIDATEFNPLVIDIAHRLSNAQTYPYGQTGVHLYTEDTRSFIERNNKKYDLIVLAKGALYGNPAGSGDTPNYSTTLEALASLIRHLKPGGLFAFSAAEANITYMSYAEERAGIPTIGHTAFIKGAQASENLVLVQQTPFTKDDRLQLQTLASARGFSIQFIDAAIDASANSILFSDDKPYLETYGTQESGALFTSLFLAAAGSGFLILIAAIAGVRKKVPPAKSNRLLLAGALTSCAALLGFGFTFFELGAVQKLFLLIGDPSFAIAVSLSSFLFFGGLGSLLLGRISRRPYAIGAATTVLTLYMLVAYMCADNAVSALLQYSLLIRCLCAAGILALPAFVCGLFFPLLLQSAGILSVELIAWVWAIDGFFGVIGGFAAKSAFHTLGLHSLYPVTAVCYVTAFLCFIYVHRRL